MFKSIAKHCVLPASYRVYLKRSGTGTKQYEPTPVDIHVYVDSKILVLNDDNGAQFTSSMQFYIDGACTIKSFDAITFENIEREARAVRTLYIGTKPDIKVVYTQ
jgi:hypothetical protein